MNGSWTGRLNSGIWLPLWSIILCSTCLTHHISVHITVVSSLPCLQTHRRKEENTQTLVRARWRGWWGTVNRRWGPWAASPWSSRGWWEGCRAGRWRCRWQRRWGTKPHCRALSPAAARSASTRDASETLAGCGTGGDKGSWEECI